MTGNPGTGKTTSAQLLAHHSHIQLEQTNVSGLVKEKMDSTTNGRVTWSRGTRPRVSIVISPNNMSDIRGSGDRRIGTAG